MVKIPYLIKIFTISGDSKPLILYIAEISLENALA